jgi:methyltransferase-like protein
MASYLDRLSMHCNDNDENDDALLNEYAEQLVQYLFNYETYVILIMNYKHTGNFDLTMAKQCILHIWHKSNGMADIKHCCKAFAESIDDQLVLLPKLQPLIIELINKYSRL